MESYLSEFSVAQLEFPNFYCISVKWMEYHHFSGDDFVQYKNDFKGFPIDSSGELIQRQLGIYFFIVFKVLA